MSFVRDTLEDWQRLADWLNQQMGARHLSIRGLAREAHIAHSVIARMANGQGPFEATSLNAVADALNVPREDVQRLAGLLRDPGKPDDEIEALVQMLQAMPDDIRQETLGLFNALINFRRRTAPTAEDRLAVFRAAFASLTDEEQDEALSELRGLLAGDQREAQSGGQ